MKKKIYRMQISDTVLTVCQNLFYTSGPVHSKTNEVVVNEIFSYQRHCKQQHGHILLKNVRSLCSAKTSLIFEQKILAHLIFCVLQDLTNL